VSGWPAGGPRRRPPCWTWGPAGGPRGRLPFRDGAFPLIINRHEAFDAGEVARVLSAGGTFITQQVDRHTYDDLWELLGLDLADQADQADQEDSWLPLAVRQVERAGLTVQAAIRGEEVERFHDVAAVLYYLRAVPWAVPDLDPDACMERLRAAHHRPGIWPVPIRQRRFLLIAAKPAG
jgi:hypothetical protein